MLKDEGLISGDLIQNLLGWKHSGFNIHAEGKAVINDDAGRERLARYMIRPPISMARLTYDRENQVVFYRTDKETLSFDPVEFLARLSVHVPNAREQTVRYMGYYSNKSRGMRKRAGLSEMEIEIMEEEAKESRSRNYAWARLIKKVFEVSPLVCKKCGGEMKVIAIITDYETRKKILKHLGLWNQRIHSPPPPNFHPPPDADAIPDIESYFQDFIPSDEQYNSAGQSNWTADF
ncbi:transposase [Candidatus Peregrinibacteria bacterium]|nr:transposase [Candidatus Peregrinibacteria bacterium]